MLIRAYERELDAAAVAELVTAGYRGDPELGGMVSGLFEGDLPAPWWRRCVVAQAGAGVGSPLVGAASARLGRHHPGGTPVAVVVGSAHRRRGVGRALLAAVRAAVADLDPPPMWATVDEREPAGVGFAAAVGFRPVARYRVVQIDPAAAALPVPAPPVPLTSLAAVADEVLVDALTALSGWAHPADVGIEPTPREVIAGETAPRIRRDSGLLAVVDGRPVGVGALAEFGLDSLALFCGTEPGRPDGDQLAAALVARLLPAAAAAGRTVSVELVGDGGTVGAALATVPVRETSARVVVQAPD